MDPIFGLPATKESKSMDTARAKNRSQERHLMRTVENLEEGMKLRNSKLHQSISDLQQVLVDLNPENARTVVYPRGLSENEKDKYKMMRRGSMPSMTLDEFDQRLKLKREGKRKHLPRRMKSDPDEKAKIVDIDSHTFCAPIQKHRQTMREAYNRATSLDVKYSDDQQEKLSRSSSSQELNPTRRWSSSSSGEGVTHYPEGFNPKQRRNTVGSLLNTERNGLKNRNGSSLDPQIIAILQKRLGDSSISDSESDH